MPSLEFFSEEGRALKTVNIEHKSLEWYEGQARSQEWKWPLETRNVKEIVSMAVSRNTALSL